MKNAFAAPPDAAGVPPFVNPSANGTHGTARDVGIAAIFTHRRGASPAPPGVTTFRRRA